jgi:hypothetical protein
VNRASRTEIWADLRHGRFFTAKRTQFTYSKTNITKNGGKKLMKSNLRNEIKSYIVRQGMTMQEVVDLLRDEHGWSDSVSNLSNKLQRESLRYTEAVQLADALGYEIVWQRRKWGGIFMTEAEKKLLQAQHRLEEAQARDRVKERKMRTRRLIQEGAILEKVLPEVQTIELSELEGYLSRKLGKQI